MYASLNASAVLGLMGVAFDMTSSCASSRRVSSRVTVPARTSAIRQRMIAIPRSGRISSTMEMAERTTTGTLPEAHALLIWLSWICPESDVFDKITGSCHSSQRMLNVSSGTMVSTQPMTSQRAPALSSATRGSYPRPGMRLSSTGLTRANRSGTPMMSERT
jgi:hypothetical protein